MFWPNLLPNIDNIRQFLFALLLTTAVLFTHQSATAQRSVVTEINAKDVPADVLKVLEWYIDISA